MQELVGYCKYCKSPVYCLDGFFNGVIIENKEICCFLCQANENKEKDGRNL